MSSSGFFFSPSLKTDSCLLFTLDAFDQIETCGVILCLTNGQMFSYVVMRQGLCLIVNHFYPMKSKCIFYVSSPLVLNRRSKEEVSRKLINISRTWWSRKETERERGNIWQNVLFSFFFVCYRSWRSEGEREKERNDRILSLFSFLFWYNKKSSLFILNLYESNRT